MRHVRCSQQSSFFNAVISGLRGLSATGIDTDKVLFTAVCRLPILSSVVFPCIASVNQPAAVRNTCLEDVFMIV